MSTAAQPSALDPEIARRLKRDDAGLFPAVPANQPEAQPANYRHGHHDRHPGTHGALDRRVRGAGHVAEQAVSDAPDKAAEHVVDQEGAVRHPGGARDRGHQGPQDRDEAAEEHGQPAAPVRASPVSWKIIAWVVGVIVVSPGLAVAFFDTYYGSFFILLFAGFIASGLVGSPGTPRPDRHSMF